MPTIDNIHDERGPTKLTRSLNTIPSLDTATLKSAVETGQIKSAVAAKIQRQVDKLSDWLAEDPQRAAEFQADPLSTMQRWNPRLTDAFAVYGLDLRVLDMNQSVCSEVANTTAYDDCIDDLLKRGYLWATTNVASAEAFRQNPDAAIDAVAAGAPPAAVQLCKARLHNARRFP